MKFQISTNLNHAGFLRQGTTLLEVIVYVALFSLLLGLTMTSLYQILDGSTRNRINQEVETEAGFLMQKIEWILLGTDVINQPAAGASSSLLSVQKYNFSPNPVVFDLDSGKMKMARGGEPAVVLNSDGVRIEQLVFDHLAAIGRRPEAIKVTLTAMASSSEILSNPAVTLQNTVFLLK